MANFGTKLGFFLWKKSIICVYLSQEKSVIGGVNLWYKYFTKQYFCWWWWNSHPPQCLIKIIYIFVRWDLLLNNPSPYTSLFLSLFMNGSYYGPQSKYDLCHHSYKFLINCWNMEKVCMFKDMPHLIKDYRKKYSLTPCNKNYEVNI